MAVLFQLFDVEVNARRKAFNDKGTEMTNYIDPTREQFELFKNLPRDCVILMLNLIRLKAQASYEDERPVSGREAYKTYGEKSFPVFSGVGGKIIWRGRPESVLIGPTDEQWDIAFIAQYPSADAFLAMVTHPDYQAIVFHRQAAVHTSRLIRMTELPEEQNFG